MNSEALRLLEKLPSNATLDAVDDDAMSGRRPCPLDNFTLNDVRELRALLSAQEPTAEHWRQATREEIGEVVISDDELQRIEQRARELATTASDDTPSK